MEEWEVKERDTLLIKGSKGKRIGWQDDKGGWQNVKERSKEKNIWDVVEEKLAMREKRRI